MSLTQWFANGRIQTAASMRPSVEKSRRSPLDRAIRRVKKADWRGNRFKEREVRNAIREEIGDAEALVDSVFEIVKAQRDY